MSRFSKFLVAGVALLATGAFAVQQLDTNFPSRLIQEFTGGVLIAPRSAGVASSDSLINANRVTRALGASATIDFSSSTVAPALSSSITVTGAQVGDPCFVGVPSAAAALQAEFSCFVSATDTVKVQFTPMNVVKGQVALSSGSPSTATATVPASSVCTCTPVGATAAIAAAGCATGVSSTTLTLTGPNTVTTTMTYDCAAPVDPASGTFYVRVISSQ